MQFIVTIRVNEVKLKMFQYWMDMPFYFCFTLFGKFMKINFSGCFDETFYSEYSMSLGNQILISKKSQQRTKWSTGNGKNSARKRKTSNWFDKWPNILSYRHYWMRIALCKCNSSVLIILVSSLKLRLQTSKFSMTSFYVASFICQVPMCVCASSATNFLWQLFGFLTSMIAIINWTITTIDCWPTACNAPFPN
jgi:hypothetical protein